MCVHFRHTDLHHDPFNLAEVIVTTSRIEGNRYIATATGRAPLPYGYGLLVEQQLRVEDTAAMPFLEPR